MKKVSKILVVIALILVLTGCTTRLTDSKNKPVTNPTTGQALTKNILCQPSDKETIELYKKNKVKIDELPKCSKFVPADGGYEGIWETIFVKPLAWFIIWIASFVKNYGVAVMVAGLLIRCALIPVTRKTTAQSENMKKMKPEMDKLEEKYRNRKDKEAQIQKSQEMMMLYKKHNISLFGGCIWALIQLPLFIAFFEAINRTPSIFEGKLLTLQLGTNPITGIGEGNYLYLLVLILVIGTTYFSMAMSQASVSSDQAKQMKVTVIFMVIFMTFASLYIPVATALYWIASSAFTIIQTLIIRRGKRNEKI